MGNRKFFFFYPFSLIYGLITDIRNFLYDRGWLAAHEFKIPVICVGNITVGGTGKTPHTEYLIELLREKFKVAVLSRGYKRKSHGFLVASTSSTVAETGDEPLQIFHKFPDIVVAVDNDRVKGVKRILIERPDIEIIILDDGFQHRSIKPGLSVLLTDYNRLISRDYLMPYGRLRESNTNTYRADLVVVTKSPDGISEKETDSICRELKIGPHQKIFFTTISYKEPLLIWNTGNSSRVFLSEENRENMGAVLVTGIASPVPFRQYLEKYFKNIDHLEFPDHHCFNGNDLKRIMNSWKNLQTQLKYLITTEKDAVRLREFTNIADSLKERFYYIPVGVTFLNNTQLAFDNLIFDYVRNNKRDS